MKELKYKIFIDHSTVDTSQFIEREIKSFRWVFEDIKDLRNFLPIYILDDERRKRDEENNNSKSTGYALSLFSTQEHSKRRFRKILSHTPKAYLKLGTHIACGILDNNDGISDSPNVEKHFSLFEYEGINLAGKYTIVEKIS